MDKITFIERIISEERLEPYLRHHDDDLNKAIAHYKSNILISEAFYPLLAILEIGLRNFIDYRLTNMFDDKEWYENIEFVRNAILHCRWQTSALSCQRHHYCSYTLQGWQH